MSVPEWIKPAVWGVIGGAIAAMIIGFGWGGWVTGSTAEQMAESRAETRASSAIVQAFTPRCVAMAEKEPEKLVQLKEENSWERDDFVIEAGWVDRVSEKYQLRVARDCARSLVEGMKSE